MSRNKRIEEKKVVMSSLGDGGPKLPAEMNPLKKKLNKVKSQEILDIRAKVQEELKGCKSAREAMELEVNSLAECVGIAIEIYKEKPVSDNSFQVSTLVNAHKAALSQLEKMKDPTAILADVEQQIRLMFTSIIKAMAFEIDRTKRELYLTLPDDKATVDDMFARMMNAIQPETQNIYDDLRLSLKKILGIRGG